MIIPLEAKYILEDISLLRLYRRIREMQRESQEINKVISFVRDK